MPDSHQNIDDWIVDGEKVAARFTLRGTHPGPYLGIPATGKSIALTGIDIFHVHAGRITEHWLEADLFGTFQQMGVLPTDFIEQAAQGQGQSA